jgi:endonuclease YncB( thermonuclease family)
VTPGESFDGTPSAYNRPVTRGRIRQAARLIAAAALAILAASCGSGSATAPPTTPPAAPPSQPVSHNVASIVDGDTVLVAPPLLGITSVRFLNVDTPEIGGDTQEPWAGAARAQLQQLLPVSTEITIQLDVQRIDPFGRVLGHAVRRDGLNANREQLRLGHAVLFVIWPNVSEYESYRSAQIDAQAAGRGIWNASAPLRELPFEYRLRQDRSSPFRPVGDFFTHAYVEPADYTRVHVNNRVFFNAPADAEAAGYRACGRDAAGAYSGSCFAEGR